MSMSNGIETERPSLCFIEPTSNRKLEIRFGYIDKQPVANISVDGECIMLIPEEVLQIASEQGWE